MRKLLFILLFPSSLWAVCPQFTYPENHKLDQEVNNICNNVRNPTINKAMIQSATISSLTISTMTACSSCTMTNAMIANATITTLNGLAVTSGKVVQIVSTTTFSGFSTTSTSFKQTNLCGSITPKIQTSTIVVIAAGDVFMNAGANFRCNFSIFRGSTNLGDSSFGLGTMTNGGAAGELDTTITMIVADVPNSLASQQYCVYMKGAATGCGGFSGGEALDYMIMMEIAP